MIQRIQSVYLLICTLLTGSLFFLPLASLSNDENTFTLLYRGLDNGTELTTPTLALAILVCVATLVSFISIFLFKKRMIQIRLCGLNMGFLIGTTGMIYFLGSQMAKELSAEISYQLPMFFPIVALIITFLAIRAIGKDEALIKSMDRIR
ncbi:DUF4293 domain-containing protein [Carboxylicivirga sp. N1Y90]|uniref:DUF4293 domain-containing protein n=1 Tax=Carboxylicivirga fragile TaxID=3417571 RepID=UPI003D33C20E|nr:DUF4293 domain-containing protein [Marinilabiliaceae bacterium N1Y90]